MVGTAWLGIGMFLVIRSRFFPVAWQQQTTIPIVSEISLPWWIGVFICLIFVAILEGSFRTNAEMIVRIAELESRFMNRDQRREIRDALSNFLVQGQRLMGLCENESGPPPDEQIGEWETRVEKYLRQKLEPSYLARYQTISVLPNPPKEATGMRSELSYEAWARLRARTTRLHEFIVDFTRDGIG